MTHRCNGINYRTEHSCPIVESHFEILKIFDNLELKGGKSEHFSDLVQWFIIDSTKDLFKVREK